jgi:DNA-binding MarR family transcriptional regulator
MRTLNSENESNVLENERKVTLEILKYVQNDDSMTQRSAAKELDIALGLVNFYLKKCIKKGWIKVVQAPANRYLYYLTPGGLAEKGELTKEYLSQSFNFFRHARTQCAEALQTCVDNKWKRVVLFGTGDLADIVRLYEGEYPVKIVALVDPTGTGTKDTTYQVVRILNDVRRYDAVILTDLAMPQIYFEQLSKILPLEKILIPPLLDVVQQSHVEFPGELEAEANG